MSLAFFVLCCVLTGAALSERFLGGRTGLGPLGRVVEVAVLSFASAVALSWALALGGLFEARWLLAGAALLGVASAVALRKSLASGFSRLANSPFLRTPVSPWGALAAAPIGLWFVFALWKGAVIPVVSDDALIYHMPKATLVFLTKAYRFAPATDERITFYPFNFELLVADVLALTRSDALTEWISTLAWLLLVVGAAALVSEVWGRGQGALGVALLTAAAPVGLLHAASHKNDLIAGFFAVAALVFLTRFAKEPRIETLVSCLVALAMGIGTKVPFGTAAGGVLVALAILATRAVRAGRISLARLVTATLLAGAIGTVLLGGVPYLENFWHTGHPFGPNPTGRPPALAGNEAIRPEHLWEFPILLLWAPFSPGTRTIWVPWNGESWFWADRYLLQSHFGAAFTLVALAGAVALWKSRRAAATLEAGPRLRMLLLAAGIGFVLPALMPRSQKAEYSNGPRYLIYLLPAVAAATLPPLLERLRARAPRGGPAVLVAGLSLHAAWYSFDVGRHDFLAPFSYVLEKRAHPEDRRTLLFPLRGTGALDFVAGPKDVVAIDAGYETWLYPVYGRTFEREILFLRPENGVVKIPDRAEWIVIDRASTLLWGAPGFDHMGRAFDYFWKGRPTEDELRGLRAAVEDPRFEPVFYDSRHNQGLFARKGPRAAAARAILQRKVHR